jgi:hypothetical protein
MSLQSERSDRGTQDANRYERLQYKLPAEAEFTSRDRHEFVEHLHSGYAAFAQ